jgi:hypothetical protein
MQEIRDNITTNIRFNPVVETGVPGFIRANEKRAEAAARPASPAAVATATGGGTRATTTGS